jgi:mitotic spindle assembly checkpoint protein MAD1
VCVCVYVGRPTRPTRTLTSRADTGQILHLRRNPAQLAEDERRATLHRLRDENERLLRELEAGASSFGVPAPTSVPGPVTPVPTQAAAVVPTPAAASATQSAALLERRLLESEKRLQRLKEVFADKVQEFREVCYTLTGYQIEMVADGTYVLRSMFAEREVDTLAFARDRATGTMQLLETDYARTVRALVAPLLRMRNSLPAITATLTLDLFGRQTAAG